MNEIKITKFMVATIKRTAQNVAPMVTKKNKIKAKIDALQAEYDSLCTQQEQFEASIRTMTGGYTTEDLVEKVVTKKLNEDGTVTPVTKYVLKYPDTIIPPVETEDETVEDCTVCDNTVCDNTVMDETVDTLPFEI